jgi:GNAT superfamily N-acetyltransferase
MKYDINQSVPAEKIADLREAVEWPRMERAYRNPAMVSYCHIAAYENDRLIGYVDCVCNGLTDAYIQDLMVYPDYQHRGIGTELMNRIIAYLKEKHIYMISVIYGEAELRPFYEKFGFTTMLCGQKEMQPPEDLCYPRLI